MATVRSGTVQLNIWRESSQAKALEDLEVLLGRYDAVEAFSLNEARKHVGTARLFCERNLGWSPFYMEGGTVQDDNNIWLLKNDVWLDVETESIQMCEKTAGTPERWMTKCLAYHAPSNRRAKLRTTHMNSHIQNPAWHTLPRWRQYGIQKDRMVLDMTDRRFGELHIMACDVNADWRQAFVRNFNHYPYAPLRSVGVNTPWDILGPTVNGTKGKRLIDPIFMWNRPYFRPVAHEVYTKLNSDHNSYYVESEIEVFR